MTRHSITRPLLLLLRDARGRFLRIRATMAELAAARQRRGPRRPRPPITCQQLTLF